MKRTSSAKKIAETITKAADLIERDGWCRGISRTPEGQHCMLGAIRDISGEVDATDWPAMNALQFQILADYGYSASPVFWNDEQRDKRKVTRLMRRTAKNVLEGKVEYKIGPFWNKPSQL